MQVSFSSSQSLCSVPTKTDQKPGSGVHITQYPGFYKSTSGIGASGASGLGTEGWSQGPRADGLGAGPEAEQEASGRWTGG